MKDKEAIEKKIEECTNFTNTLFTALPMGVHLDLAKMTHDIHTFKKALEWVLKD